MDLTSEGIERILCFFKNALLFLQPSLLVLKEFLVEVIDNLLSLSCQSFFQENKVLAAVLYFFEPLTRCISVELFQLVLQRTHVVGSSKQAILQTLTCLSQFFGRTFSCLDKLMDNTSQL